MERGVQEMAKRVWELFWGGNKNVLKLTVVIVA